MDMMRIIPFLWSASLLVIACGSASTTEIAAAPVDKAPNGKDLFGMHCALCHGRDGKLGMSGAKDLSVSALSREEMIAIISNGKGSMMAYRNVLTSKQIELVTEHVRSLHR